MAEKKSVKGDGSEEGGERRPLIYLPRKGRVIEGCSWSRGKEAFLF